jgi:glycosyl hydrolase family 59/glycosyl hydrolase family 59 (putative galactocerebrosidase)
MLKTFQFRLEDSRISVARLAIILFAMALAVCACQTPSVSVPVTTITIMSSGKGRVFEGIGAVSAGASSRLLVDYPEPERSQILDYLFKHHYGASLQHLKVEIGSDVNSTDGSEPSHIRSPSDLNFSRGYEWWLMEEAKKRNPDIVLDSLAWGAPGWIGQGHFYSPDMARYAVEFIRGGKSAHGLDIRYTGVWNETRQDTAYVKLMKRALLDHVPSTKLVCCDLYQIDQQWSIIGDLGKDPELKAAVDVVSVHYPRDKGRVTTPEAAKALGKPLWSSEDQPAFGPAGQISQRNWNDGGRTWAHMLNENYIEGRFTATEIWSPVTSYYDILAAPNSGLMYANTPWSGHYEVQSAIWVTAHTTQFAETGWRYIDSACGYLGGKGSYVTLRSSGSGDYSVVVETVEAKTPQTVVFVIAGDLSLGTVHVWETNAAKNFEHVTNVIPENGSFRITLDPDSLYSLTTTAGQSKGGAQPPPAAPFPMPYAENFDGRDLGKSPRFFADQNGAFEVQPCKARKGRCLEQVITQKPIPWGPLPDPYTLLGSTDWSDYTLSADALLGETGDVTLIGRIDDADVFKDDKAPFPAGYVLELKRDGQWELLNTKYKAPTAKLAFGKVRIPLGAWHHLELHFKGTSIQALIDGASVANVSDETHRAGMVGLGSGWNAAQFDNFKVK